MTAATTQLTPGRLGELRGDIAARLSAYAADRALLAVAAGSVVASFVFAFAAIARHRSYHSVAMDFAFFDQIVWNTSQGRWFETSFVPYNFMGQHVEPVLLIFAALYRITPAPEWLLVGQALGAAAAAIPLYFFARARIAVPWLAALVAGSYLLSPTLQRALAFDYHSEVFAPLLVFSGVALLFAGRRQAALVALLALLLLKEDAALVLIGLAAPLWMWHERRLAAIVAAAGVLWIVLIVGLFMPAVRGGESDLESRYDHLGDGASGILRGIVADPQGAARHALGDRQRDAILRNLAYGGGLPLLAPGALLAAAPNAALQFLSSHPPQQSLRLQYGAQVLPLVTLATVEGLRRLRHFGRPRLVHLASALIVAGTLWGLLMHSQLPPGVRFAPDAYTRPAHAAAIERALGRIPDDASVSAQSGLAAHLSQRERIWEFPVLNDAEYVVLDLRGVVARPHQQAYAGAVAALPGKGYVLTWSDGSVQIYSRQDARGKDMP